MKILYLSFYFRPDLCAGSFRNSALFEELVRQVDGDVEMTVLTTAPNRYATFRATAEREERVGRHRIIRFPLPAHQSGFKDQVKSFHAFSRQVLHWVRDHNYDGVFASSSRLFTAWLGARISRRKRVPLYLDMRDIFSENITEILGGRPHVMILKRFLYLIERYTFSTAGHINLVSFGFEPHFRRYSTSDRTIFTNGIDDIFLEFCQDSTADGNSDPKRIVYAGNMGEGQGLHAIIPDAAVRLGNQFEFRLFGDGGRRKVLEAEVVKRGLTNVVISDPIPRPQLIEEYSKADYLFLHLNAYKAFEWVIPSKVFEYGATDKPILAGASGFPAEFMAKHLPNTWVFPPLDVGQMVSILRSGPHPRFRRDAFRETFCRAAINRKMAASIREFFKRSWQKAH